MTTEKERGWTSTGQPQPMTGARLIARETPRQTDPTRRWFSSHTLPSDLLKSAHARVRHLTGFILVISLVGAPFFYSIGAEIIAKTEYSPWLGPLMLVSLISTVVLYLVARFRWLAPQRLLDVALIYEVVLAFCTAMGRHIFPWEGSYHPDWSEVAVWIIIFSVLIPNTFGKTLGATLLTMLMDPLGLLIFHSLGNPWPPADVLQMLFGPTVFAAIVGLFASHYMFRMGQDIDQARQMGRYRLVKRLGSGGMGEVWLAEHRMLARRGAIKVITPGSLRVSEEASRRLLKRFEREARATAMLESEHTIRIYDFGTTSDESFYYAMEYLNGMDLEEVVKRFGPLPAERVVAILLQVCDSLAEAHQAGLIHRDIKPANIYLCRKGLIFDVVKVLDFGLVKSLVAESFAGEDSQVTIDGNLTGTPAYMPPELALAKDDVDERSDIYSLGCVAYWALTGELVFPEPTPIAMVMSHINAPVVPPSQRTELDVPPALDRLILACLAKEPGARPQSALALASELGKLSLGDTWTRERATRWWKIHLPGQSCYKESIIR